MTGRRDTCTTFNKLDAMEVEMAKEKWEELLDKHDGDDKPSAANVIAFGYGHYGVDIGTLGDTPAVFIIPNSVAGPVGEKMPLELQGPLKYDRLPDEWTAMTFPTRERCKEVADALVGSRP